MELEEKRWVLKIGVGMELGDGIWKQELEWNRYMPFKGIEKFFSVKSRYAGKTIACVRANGEKGKNMSLVINILMPVLFALAVCGVAALAILWIVKTTTGKMAFTAIVWFFLLVLASGILG